MTGAGRRRRYCRFPFLAWLVLASACHPAPATSLTPTTSCLLPVGDGVRPQVVAVSTDQSPADPALDPALRFLAAARSTDSWRDCAGRLGPALGNQQVELRTQPGDPRDLLDGAGRVDLLFSRNRRVIEYARAKRDWAVVPLPFDRRYVLATADTLPTGAQADGGLLDALQQDARAPSDAPGCPRSTRRAAGRWGGEVLYLADDPAARDLATRLVALGGQPNAPTWLPRVATARQLRALGVDTASLRSATKSGSWSVAVVADPLDGCASLLLPDAAARLPLAETRAHLVVRRGLGPLVLDERGIVRMAAGQP